MIMIRKTSCSVLLSMLAVSLVSLSAAPEVDARNMRGGGGGSARASVNRAPAPNAQRAQRINPPAPAYNNRPNAGNRTDNRNTINTGNRGNNTYVNNSTHNVNVDNHRDVNIDVDGRGRYGYDDHYHPIATAAAVTATVAVTSAVIGAMLTPTQVPVDCVHVVRDNIAYMQCGNTWLQPQYQGNDVVYVVVNAP